MRICLLLAGVHCLAFLDPSEAAALRSGRRIDLGDGTGAGRRLRYEVGVAACDHHRRTSRAAQCDAAHRCGERRRRRGSES